MSRRTLSDTVGKPAILLARDDYVFESATPLPNAGRNRCGWGGSGIVDRFGNVYGSFNVGMSPIPVKAGISYSEGYICSDVYSLDCETQLPSESQIESTLQGFCAGLGAGAGIGATVVGCTGFDMSGHGAALIYSVGLYVPFAGPYGSIALEFYKNPGYAWERAVQERMNGYYLNDLR